MATLLDRSDAGGDWTLAHDRSTLAFGDKTMRGLMTVRFTEFTGHGHIGANGVVRERSTSKPHQWILDCSVTSI